MQVTLDIPDFLGESLTASGKDPARVIFEALAQEGYRNRTLFEGAMDILKFDSPDRCRPFSIL